MKIFHFRLQQYLDFNKQQEDVQRLLLYQVRLVYKEELGRLESLDRKIDELVDYTKAARQNQVQIELMLMSEVYHRDLQEQKTAQALAVEEALGKVNAEQKVLIDIQRRRKMLERLKGRKWQEYYQNLLKKEQKELDEIGSIRFCRQQGGVLM
ncbi:MAG: flagellar export protein FliJ [Syntrophaceticus sp.]|jgi:flagellar FliJ protein|nr:flagellar export protein FliJ [Eubacteriales bacterium]MDD3314375.1 flagellar export protein FliJ [Syntrophaceticus sp.]MDD4783293.1 flagellar export protein FliJ [Syntrophaceticus sp.]